jgi:hypothetical protein
MNLARTLAQPLARPLGGELNDLVLPSAYDLKTWARPGMDVTVGQWDDQSGNDKHFVAAGSSDITTDNKGRDCIDFQGASAWMASSIASLAQPTVIFIVVKASVVGTATRIMFDSNNSSLRHVLYDSTTGLQALATTNVALGVSATTDWTYFVCVFAGSSSQVWRNGSLIGSPSLGANNLDGFRIGCGATGAGPFAGKIAEAGVISNPSSIATCVSDMNTWCAVEHNI